MRVTVLLMTATFLGVPPNVASGAPKDGDILSQDACARRPVGTYQEYVRGFRASVSEEVSEAKATNVPKCGRA